jgi:hypothetical protein
MLRPSLLISALLSAGGAAAAPGPPAVPEAAAAVAKDAPPPSAAYCEYVRGAAESESALLLSPSVALQFGIINGAGFLTADLFTPPPTSLRLNVGLRWSVGRLYQGLKLRSRARAECERYGAVSDIYTFLYGTSDKVTRAALAAKIEVLRAEVPAGEQILASVEKSYSQGLATAAELDGTKVRLDRLREDLARSLGTLEGLPELPAPARPLRALLDDRIKAEERVERAEASLRRAQAWDVSVQAGYDQVFGAMNQTPVFALLSASLNPGLFWQPKADARARAGRLKWAAAQVEGPNQRAERAVRELAALRRGEQARLREVSILVADLSGRLRSLEALGTKQVQRYRDHVWFDLAAAKAEAAYLAAHVQDLGALLGDDAR